MDADLGDYCELSDMGDGYKKVFKLIKLFRAFYHCRCACAARVTTATQLATCNVGARRNGEEKIVNMFFNSRSDQMIKQQKL